LPEDVRVITVTLSGFFEGGKKIVPPKVMPGGIRLMVSIHLQANTKKQSFTCIRAKPKGQENIGANLIWF